jgi:hypothetical protein
VPIVEVVGPATHTPGPWKEKRKLAIYSADDEPICAVFPAETEERSKADARLIAAAPDLLEALQFICNGIGGGGDAPEAVLIKWKRRADDAIAKAEGRAD